MSITVQNTDLSLADHEAMIRETAQVLGIETQTEHSDTGTFVTFDE